MLRLMNYKLYILKFVLGWIIMSSVQQSYEVDEWAVQSIGTTSNHACTGPKAQYSSCVLINYMAVLKGVVNAWLISLSGYSIISIDAMVTPPNMWVARAPR